VSRGPASPKEPGFLLRPSCLAWRFTNSDLADFCTDPATTTHTPTLHDHHARTSIRQYQAIVDEWNLAVRKPPRPATSGSTLADATVGFWPPIMPAHVGRGAS
jgi:hypothetical protein